MGIEILVAKRYQKRGDTLTLLRVFCALSNVCPTLINFLKIASAKLLQGHINEIDILSNTTKKNLHCKSHLHVYFKDFSSTT